MSTIPDKIKILYVSLETMGNLAGRINFVKWSRNGGPSEVGDYAGGQTIPDDVRIAIALLVAPGLVDIKR